MGSCCTSDTKTIRVHRNKDGEGSQVNPNYNPPPGGDKPLSAEEVESRRLEMAAQYEKKLAHDKNRGVTKEGIIGEN